jgi:hypothetical protein
MSKESGPGTSSESLDESALLGLGLCSSWSWSWSWSVRADIRRGEHRLPLLALLLQGTHRASTAVLE